MSRKRKYEVKFVCNKCGKDMNSDANNVCNNENWKAIKTTCDCGGKGTLKVINNNCEEKDK